MCGVLGIYAYNNPISTLSAQSLLQLLVHRGQDASGICYLDSYKVHTTEKIKGPPDKIPMEDDLGLAVIGSTRYPTLGSRIGEVSEKKFAQPFSYQSSLGTLSIAHNGNITNLSELVDDTAQYQSDAEYICFRLGQLIDDHEDLKVALVKLTDELDGAYSLVGILGEDVFSYRDPRGIRPLVYGTNGTHHIISSESIVLQQAGVMEVHDVNPGELVYFSAEGVRSEQIVEPQNISHCYFEYVYFANSVSTINSKNVYSTRLQLGRKLGEQILDRRLDDRLDFVIPVPDTSKAAAETLSETINVPIREGIMKNRSSLRTFIMPTEDKRESAAKSKYLFIDEYLRGKNILLVDDSIVRGFTMKYLIRILKKDYKVNKVNVAITCPPQRYACYYGVDFGTDTELIAYDDKPIDRIREEIGADTLTYLTLENLKAAIGMNTLCTACLTGEYPTPHGKNLRLKIMKGEIGSEETHYET